MPFTALTPTDLTLPAQAVLILGFLILLVLLLLAVNLISLLPRAVVQLYYWPERRRLHAQLIDCYCRGGTALSQAPAPGWEAAYNKTKHEAVALSHRLDQIS